MFWAAWLSRLANVQALSNLQRPFSMWCRSHIQATSGAMFLSLTVQFWECSVATPWSLIRAGGRRFPQGSYSGCISSGHAGLYVHSWATCWVTLGQLQPSNPNGKTILPLGPESMQNNGLLGFGPLSCVLLQSRLLHLHGSYVSSLLNCMFWHLREHPAAGPGRVIARITQIFSALAHVPTTKKTRAA